MSIIKFPLSRYQDMLITLKHNPLHQWNENMLIDANFEITRGRRIEIWHQIQLNVNQNKGFHFTVTNSTHKINGAEIKIMSEHEKIEFMMRSPNIHDWNITTILKVCIHLNFVFLSYLYF